MKIVEVGTQWWAGGDRKFLVVEINNDEDNTWVHYINTQTMQEYNCYVEAFLERFIRLPA